jgi:hypothetical protein
MVEVIPVDIANAGYSGALTITLAVVYNQHVLPMVELHPGVVKMYEKPYFHTIKMEFLSTSLLQYAGGEFNATIESYQGTLAGLASEILASGTVEIDGSSVTFLWRQDPPFPPEFSVTGSINGNTINIPATGLQDFSISNDSTFGACVFADASLEGSCTIVNENTFECVLDVSGDVQQHHGGNFCNSIGGANLHFELTLTRQ